MLDTDSVGLGESGKFYVPGSLRVEPKGKGYEFKYSFKVIPDGDPDGEATVIEDDVSEQAARDYLDEAVRGKDLYRKHAEDFKEKIGRRVLYYYGEQMRGSGLGPPTGKAIGQEEDGSYSVWLLFEDEHGKETGALKYLSEDMGVYFGEDVGWVEKDGAVVANRHRLRPEFGSPDENYGLGEVRQLKKTAVLHAPEFGSGGESAGVQSAPSTQSGDPEGLDKIQDISKLRMEQYRKVINYSMMNDSKGMGVDEYVPGSVRMEAGEQPDEVEFTYHTLGSFKKGERKWGRVPYEGIRRLDRMWRDHKTAFEEFNNVFKQKLSRRMAFALNKDSRKDWRVERAEVSDDDGELKSRLFLVNSKGEKREVDGDVPTEWKWLYGRDEYWDERDGVVMGMLDPHEEGGEDDEDRSRDGIVLDFNPPKRPDDSDGPDGTPPPQNKGKKRGELIHLDPDKNDNQERIAAAGLGAAAGAVLPKLFKAFIRMTPQGRIATGLGAAFGAFNKARAGDERSDALREAFGEELTKEQRGGFSRMMTPPGRNPAFDIRGER